MRVIGTDGIINTLLVSPTPDSFPADMAFDAAGNLYVVFIEESPVPGFSRIYRLSPGGDLTWIAGCGGCYGDGGHVSQAQFTQPRAFARDLAGNIYVSDELDHRVRRIGADGVVTTIAGTGEAGFSGDGGKATEARLNHPAGVTVDGAGNVYIADQKNHRVRRVAPDGFITTLAGTGDAGYNGDGGPAKDAQLFHPEDVAIDRDGAVLIADTVNHRIRRVTSEGIISTIAGSGEPGSEGDGGPATAARLQAPKALAVDGDGSIYIADGTAHRIRRVTPAGTISTFAGTGETGYSGDGGPATQARIWAPQDIAIGPAGRVWIADAGNSLVRLVDRDGTIASLGTPEGGRLTYRVQALLPVSGARLYIARKKHFSWEFPWIWMAVPQGGEPPHLAPLIDAPSVMSAARGYGGGLSPGEVISLFGGKFGPKVPVSGIGKELGGTKLWIGGLPATLLYARDWQLNAVVPYGISGKTTVGVRVERFGEASNTVRLPVVPAAPGIFWVYDTVGGPAILNEDYTLNRGWNPAKCGEVVMIWATGFGQTEPPGRDGAINEEPLPRPVLPVTATVGGLPADVLFAGGAPGMVAGVTQVNVRIPQNLQPPPGDGQVKLLLRVGDTPSRNDIGVYLAPCE